MALVNINWNPTVKELRSFALIWTPLFVLGFAAYTFFMKGNTLVAGVLAGVVGLVFLVGLVLPQAIKPLFVLLMVVTFPIGFIVSHVLLGLMFYGVFTPIGLLMRIGGRDAMGKRLDKNASTYFTKHVNAPSSERYFRQF